MKKLTLLLTIILFFVLLTGSTPGKNNKDESNSPPILRLDPQGHTALATNIAFTPDEKELITASFDKTIKIWDVETGTLKRTIRGYIDAGDEGKIYSIAIDKTGKYLACGGSLGWNKNNRGGLLRIFDYRTGKLLKLIKGHNNIICSLEFSPDCKYLASGSGDGEIKLWETENFKEYINSSSIFAKPVYGLSFSSDSTLLATVSDDRLINIYETKTGRLIQTKKDAHDDGIHRVSFSPDGKYIATSGYDGKVKLWSSKDLKFIKIINDVKEDYSNNVKFLDNETVICGGTYQEYHKDKWIHPVYIININNNNKKAFWVHTNTIQHIAILKDKKTIATTGGNDNETIIWNTETLNIKHTIKGVGHGVFAVGFGKDNESIYFGNKNTSLAYLAKNPIEKGFSLIKKEVSLEVSEDNYLRVKFEDNNIKLSSTGKSYDRTLYVGDKKVILPRDYDTLETYTYSPDGKYIIAGSELGLYKIDSKTLEITGEFIGHEDTILSVSVSPDSKTLVSGSKDQTIRFWDIERFNDKEKFIGYNELMQIEGVEVFIIQISQIYPDINLEKEGSIKKLYYRLKKDYINYNCSFLVELPQIKSLLTIFIGDDNEWIAFTPDGYYDSSLNGGKYAGWHFNKGEDHEAEFYTFEQYSSLFYRPDIIKLALERKKPDLPKVAFDTKPPVIDEFKLMDKTIYNDKETITTDKDTFDISLLSHGEYELKGVEIFVNGRAVAQRNYKGKPNVIFDKQSGNKKVEADYTFQLTDRETNFKIYTVDEKGFTSSPKTIKVIYTNKNANVSFYKLDEKIKSIPKPEGKLIIVNIGINEYTNKKMKEMEMPDLGYAEKDANDIGELFKSQKGRFFKEVEVMNITKSKRGKNITKDDVLNAVDDIKLLINSPEDRVLVFFSGHGYRYENKYYLLTSEADPTDSNTLQKTAVLWGELGNKLKDMTMAKEIVVMIDACYSGAVSSLELGYKWRDKGLILITSSKDGQQSQEAHEWQNGAFTKAIVDGFNKLDKAGYANADVSQDDVLIVGEVLKYAVEEVRELTNGQQTPWVPNYDEAIEGKILGVVK